MSMSQNPQHHEHPSTYFVQDRESQRELERLLIQDHLLNVSMGGVLSEQSTTSTFHRILDVGCGSGSWVIEAAQAYPAISFIGIDISNRLVEYARVQAESQQVSDRVEFAVMDALRMLEFPDAYFDLVNIRLGVSYLRTWDWPKVLGEMLRVLRPGGTIRLTDQEIMHESTSPAATRCNEMFLCSFFRAGNLFKEDSKGITDQLVPLLQQSGCSNIQTQPHALVYLPGSPEVQSYVEDMTHALHTSRPFLQKWGCSSVSDDPIFEQAISEMHQPDFTATWRFLTAWATKPE